VTLISASHKKFLAQQSQYVYDPVKWAYEQLKFDCDTWQKGGLDDLVTKRYCAWSTGTGVGKTANLAISILHFLATRPFPKIPCTAPTQHQLFDVLWAEIAKWLRRNEMLSKMFKWTQTKVSLKGHEEEWYAVARTSRPKPGEQSAEGLQGFHAEHLLFVIDEASAVDDQIFNAVDGALTTPEARVLMASNPTRRRGYFFRTITDPAATEHWAVRFVDANTARAVTKESIARILKIYGKDSDYYRVKVLGVPPLTDFAALIDEEQIFAAHNREIGEDPNPLCVFGVDPARFGDDHSVIYIRKGNKIVDRISVRGMDTMQVAKLVMEQAQTYNPTYILVDVIGIGSGVADRVREEIRKTNSRTPSRVIDVNVAEKAVNEEQFMNKRAEMFWHLRTRIETISIPFSTPLLDEELVALRYGAEKKIQLEKKEEMKRELGRSPNDADALALCFYNEISSGYVHCSSTYFKVGEKEIEPSLAQEREVMERTAVVGARRYAQFRSSGNRGFTQI